MSKPRNSTTRKYKPRRKRPVAERFWEKVDKSGDCWLWTAYKLPEGYGRFFYNGRHVMSHRFAYEMVNGPIPEGLTIDHLCRNRACCNPDHLEAVTHRENMARGFGPIAHALRTNHCQRGHEFTPENTQYDKAGKRSCKACQRIWKTENKEAVRESQQRWIEKNRDLHNYRRRVARKNAKAAAQTV